MFTKNKTILFFILFLVSVIQIIIIFIHNNDVEYKKIDTQNNLMVFNILMHPENSINEFHSDNKLHYNISEQHNDNSINSIFIEKEDNFKEPIDSYATLKSKINLASQTIMTFNNQSYFNNISKKNGRNKSQHLDNKSSHNNIKIFNNSIVPSFNPEINRTAKNIFKNYKKNILNKYLKNETLKDTKNEIGQEEFAIDINKKNAFNHYVDTSNINQNNSLELYSSLKRNKSKPTKTILNQSLLKNISQKPKFKYMANDKYIQRFYEFNKNKSNNNILEEESKDLYKAENELFKLSDDEKEFANDAVKKRILIEDEELPMLQEISQNYKLVSYSNLFSNDTIKVISMSLYGDENRYTMGAVRNAELIKIYFPGWRLRIYMESPSLTRYNPVPRTILEKLKDLDAELIYIDGEARHLQPMMWRFLVADDPSVDVFLVRDCDSRLNERDAIATHAWLQTKAAFYCTRDHPSHSGYSISGGLWGGRPKLLKHILRKSWHEIMISDRSYGKGGYFVDMAFLQNRIWKKVDKYAYCSDSVSCDVWLNAHPFPIKRRGYEHVGQVFDENENVRPIDIRILRRTGENENCKPNIRLQ